MKKFNPNFTRWIKDSFAFAFICIIPLRALGLIPPEQSFLVTIKNSLCISYMSAVIMIVVQGRFDDLYPFED
jgi:hypothetical protein